MIDDPYNPTVREYFDSPLHCGTLKDAAVGYFEDQGLKIRLAASTAGGTILSMRFKAWACPHVIAAAEAVCRHYEGRETRDLENFPGEQIMQDLGIPIEKTGRILVLEDAVRSLGQAIKDRT
jgi:NifU-like protein involved in Fe-S cluster formation